MADSQENAAFEWCSARVDNATTWKDLLPFEDTKSLLSNKLKQLNNSNETSSQIQLQNVYFETSPIDEILSNDIFVKIIKYLDSSHYKYIPLLSKNINSIVHQNMSIFNYVTF